MDKNLVANFSITNGYGILLAGKSTLELIPTCNSIGEIIEFFHQKAVINAGWTLANVIQDGIATGSILRPSTGG